MRHLEKQNELLMDAYRSMSHELHKLQVEEEMLMRKFYELMSAQGLAKKNEFSDDVADDDSFIWPDHRLVTSEEGEIGNGMFGCCRWQRGQL
ncbi:hypothetical protein F0562_006288 [Nyssa sinensis]|uniref:Uncharacterized protein n=1 Tax=Nyssa sinensis TaxID=561372 RepID=A0A5J5AMX3_9ASTE|nr:hypothetical protein F0562_006288 [Nyssa sinensis]